jgi:transposase
LAQDPFSGAIIVFRAKRADRVKILVWDGIAQLPPHSSREGRVHSARAC